MAVNVSSAIELKEKLDKYVQQSEGEYKEANRAQDSTYDIAEKLQGANISLANQWRNLGDVTSETINKACENLKELDFALERFIAETTENEEQLEENVKAFASQLDEIKDAISQLH